MYHICPVSMEIRKHENQWNQSFRQMWAAIWVLVSEHGSSKRALSVLNHWVFSVAPRFSYLITHLFLSQTFIQLSLPLGETRYHPIVSLTTYGAYSIKIRFSETLTSGNNLKYGDSIFVNKIQLSTMVLWIKRYTTHRQTSKYVPVCNTFNSTKKKKLFVTGYLWEEIQKVELSVILWGKDWFMDYNMTFPPVSFFIEVISMI